MENCTHVNKVETIDKFWRLGHGQIYIYCPDCKKTIFIGWRPLTDEEYEESI
jgi:hypothetical protein